MGHLDAAAGVTGLIKVVLSLKHGQLPPSLNYEQPNPQIDFQNSPFYINTQLREWKSEAGKPRRAGVSAFGVGGTNAHVVVEEAPAQRRTETAGEKRRNWQLLTLSARTETALAQARKNLAGYLERETEVDLEDVAYTLQVGRRPFACRWSGVCEKREDAILQLRAGVDARSEIGSSHVREEGEEREGEKGSEVAALRGMGQSWEKGIEIDWGALHAGGRRHRVPLPTYPFERKRYWIEPDSPPRAVVEDRPVAAAARTVASSQNESVYSPRPLLRNSYVPPQNEAEQKAVAILERALGIHPVGVTDQYGELGGDSLTAVRVIDQLNIAFHSSLRVVDLYEGLTIRDLVRLIGGELSTPQEILEPSAKTDRRQTYRQSRRLLHQPKSA
jgi:acyl transferase domain-containing protein